MYNRLKVYGYFTVKLLDVIISRELIMLLFYLILYCILLYCLQARFLLGQSPFRSASQYIQNIVGR